MKAPTPGSQLRICDTRVISVLRDSRCSRHMLWGHKGARGAPRRGVREEQKCWPLQTAQVLRAWPCSSGLGPHCMRPWQQSFLSIYLAAPAYTPDPLPCLLGTALCQGPDSAPEPRFPQGHLNSHSCELPSVTCWIKPLWVCTFVPCPAPDLPTHLITPTISRATIYPFAWDNLPTVVAA